MATPQIFPPLAWRILGLSIASLYSGLGLMGCLTPAFAAKQLGLWPVRPSTPEADRLAKASATLVGARDLTTGIALFAFDFRGEPASMGVVILSTMVVMAVDVVWTWKARGTWLAVFYVAGAVIMAWIAVNLLYLRV